MTRLYDFAARLSGCLAGLCMALALAASSARADDDSGGSGTPGPCETACAGLEGDDYTACVNNCLSGKKCGSHSLCTVTCGPGVFPACGNGACNKVPSDCDGCNCRLIYINKKATFCECTF